MKIVINGAGIAGPALAYWLQKSGHDVLRVEQSPRFRGGGYVIDFWGLGYDIAEKMGLIPGCGLAMAEAYVLAGELDRAGGDYRAAFTRYEERMMPFLKRKQESAASFATSFVPRTAIGIAFRRIATRLLRFPVVANYFIGRDLRDDFELPDYTGV